jgi:hypothetical protein
MTQIASAAALRDHDVALHMNVSAARQPVRTRAVGVLAHACPLLALTLPLRALGQTQLPASLFTAGDARHLHPAVVAAGAHATCELVATKLGIAAPGCDEGLFARLPRGRRALGAPLARWTEMALHRLQWMVQFVELVSGGTRFHGLVRWVPNAGERPENRGSDAAVQSVMHHLMLAFASPPIVTLRRAPSLEYYRASGVMIFRNFGAFMPTDSEGR